MSKGKWHSTYQYLGSALALVRQDLSITTRAALVKALMKQENISYSVANRIVGLLEVRGPRNFQRFKREGKS